MVICNPFGQEAIRCHRLLRVLADRLSRDGFHVLRFDYFSTGDSDGDDTEGTLETFINDVGLADAEARARSGCTCCSWFGLRLGASVAALATSRVAIEPQRLVLWDPIIHGSDYIDELHAANIAAGSASYGARWLIEARLRKMVAGASSNEALGFPLSPQLRDQIGAISPDAYTSIRASKITILCGKTSNFQNEFALLRFERQVRLNIKPVNSEIVWTTNEAMNSAIVPANILQEIISSFVDEQ